MINVNMPTVVEKTNYTARTVVPFMAARVSDVKDLPSEIELIKAGMWNGSWKGDVNITAADLEEMKANFDAGIGLPGRGLIGLPIDFSHEDWEKAAGWIKELQIRPDENGVMTLYSVNTEWTTSGAEALLGGEFKCISPSFWPRCFGEWCDPEDPTIRASNVLVGAGLTNIPFFKDLSPLTASRNDNDSQNNHKSYTMYVKEIEGDTRMPTLDQVRVKNAESLTDDEKAIIKASVAELSDQEKTKFAAVLADQAPTPNANQDTDTDATKLQADIASGKKVVVDAGEFNGLKASVADMKIELDASKKERAQKIVDENIARGAIKADQRDTWVDAILANSNAQAMLEAIPGNKVVADGKVGDAAASDLEAAEDELQNKIIAARSEEANRGKSYVELRDQILASDKALAERVNNKVEG